MDNLITMLDYYLRACKATADRRTREKYFNQAFGVAQYHEFLFSYDEKKVCDLWDTYKPQFEELVYGV